MKSGTLLLAALVLGCGISLASAQEQKTAIGPVSKIAGDQLTVDTGKGILQFVTNKDTSVKVTGGGSKAQAAKSEGQKGVKITEVVHVGDQVAVKYSEISGKLVAADIDVMARRPKAAQPVK